MAKNFSFPKHHGIQSAGDAEKIAEYLVSVKPNIAQNKDGGVIKGRVVNETKEEAVEGVELTLTSFMGDRPTDEKKTETDNPFLIVQPFLDLLHFFE